MYINFLLQYPTLNLPVHVCTCTFSPKLCLRINVKHYVIIIHTMLFQVILSPEVISQLHTPTPAIFISIHYSDFETEVTPVKHGARYNVQ